MRLRLFESLRPVNRNAAVRFRYERDEVESSGEPASRDYEVNKVTVGLTLRL